jgi:integrase
MLDSGDAFKDTHGHFTASFPVLVFIQFAYKLPLTEGQRQSILSHLPKWVASDRFTIESVVQPPNVAAARDNRRFFYSDTTCLRTLVKAAWRTLDAVFTRSGVAAAHPHRFRHTLASELLGQDGSIEKVAGILGDGEITIRRYYAKWTPAFQGLQDDLIRKVHGTELAQAPESASKC